MDLITEDKKKKPLKVNEKDTSEAMSAAVGGMSKEEQLPAPSSDPTPSPAPVPDPEPTAGGISGDLLTLAQGFSNPRGLEALIDEVAGPDATEEEKAAGVLRAKKDQMLKEENGYGDPDLDPGKELVKAFAEDPAGGAELVKSAGGELDEYLGALLTTIVPAIAGAAIGGKRGALHAVKGAGQGLLKTIEKKDEIEKEQRELQAEMDLEAFKAGLEPGSDGYNPDWLKEIPAETRSKLQDAPELIIHLKEIAQDLRKLNSNPIAFQAGQVYAQSEAYDILSRFNTSLARIAKAMGDTGNIAFQEQQMIKDAIIGNSTANSASAARRMEALANSLQRSYLGSLKRARVMYGLGGDALIKAAESGGVTGYEATPLEKLDPKIRTVLERARVKLAKRSDVKEVLKEQGIKVGDDVFDYMGYE